jgi:hypothetical protein
MLPGYGGVLLHGAVRDVQAGELVAVIATNLQGVFLGPEVKPMMARLRTLTPVDRVGYSIFMYRPTSPCRSRDSLPEVFFPRRRVLS